MTRRLDHGTCWPWRPFGRPRLWLPTGITVLLAGFAVLVGSSGPTRAAADASRARANAGNAQPADQDRQASRVGRIVRILLPISGPSLDKTRLQVRRLIAKSQEQSQRLVLVLEFDVPANQTENARNSEFGSAYELATFLTSRDLSGVMTVAYAPHGLQGHAVLVAMACDELIMVPDAVIGPAVAEGGVVDAAIRSAYQDIAARRDRIPSAVALGMLGAGEDVLQVKTENETVIIPASQLAELRKRRTVQSTQVIIPAGQRGQFTGNEARALRIASYLASDRRALAEALELPPEALEDDATLGGGWRPLSVALKGPVKPSSIDYVQRQIDQALSHDVNFLCLWIESAGGSAVDSMRLATYLAQLDPGRVRTVAYVPTQARGDAALVALGCDEIVMHSRAVLGGPGAYAFTDADIHTIRRVIRAELAPQKKRFWSLPVALIDPELMVMRCSSKGRVEYFSEEELLEQAAPGQWQKEGLITAKGGPLQLTGQQAGEYDLAKHVVESFAGFKEVYGLEDDPALAEPTWADHLIEWLASGPIAVLLLIVGFSALYIELHAPGIGVGAFVSTVCFVLFFWSSYLGGQAGWLEILLFLAGLACLALEVFLLPGLGIFGFGGAALVLASIILASQTFIIPRNSYQLAQLQRSLWMVTGTALGVIVVAMIIRRWLPRAPIFNQIFLEPPSDDEVDAISHREALVNVDDMVGARGVTTTPLLPGGKARFGNRLLDVMTDGVEIPRGTEVEVVEVHGSRLIVQPAGPAA